MNKEEVKKLLLALTLLCASVLLYHTISDFIHHTISFYRLFNNLIFYLIMAFFPLVIGGIITSRKLILALELFLSASLISIFFYAFYYEVNEPVFWRICLAVTVIGFIVGIEKTRLDKRKKIEG